MEVMVIATKGCTHCANLSRELDDLGVKYRLVYAEDAPELADRFGIRHSPNLVVDGEVKFRRLPTQHELRECLYGK